MDRPLVLDRPIVISGEPGAKVVFSQKGEDKPWSAAIKIHSGHTTLESFAVRFATPIRWTSALRDEQAVIGVTDASDPGPRDLKADLNFRGLDLEGPPPATKWEEAPRLIRLGYSVCGTIEKNTLRGGSIELWGGPWRIEGNTHTGTMPGTQTFSVISTHRTHDLIVRDNVTRTDGPSGKTWRFLVMTGTGDGDIVEGNVITGVGPRDDDTMASENAPEIVLTEAYSLHFEGKPSGLSPDGRVLVLPFLQGDPAASGDVVAILSGPSAGQYRKIAQSLGPTTYLMASPLPKGDYAISIASGFVRPAFRRNKSMPAEGPSRRAWSWPGTSSGPT